MSRLDFRNRKIVLEDGKKLIVVRNLPTSSLEKVLEEVSSDDRNKIVIFKNVYGSDGRSKEVVDRFRERYDGIVVGLKSSEWIKIQAMLLVEEALKKNESERIEEERDLLEKAKIKSLADLEKRLSEGEDKEFFNGLRNVFGGKNGTEYLRLALDWWEGKGIGFIDPDLSIKVGEGEISLIPGFARDRNVSLYDIAKEYIIKGKIEEGEKGKKKGWDYLVIESFGGLYFCKEFRKIGAGTVRKEGLYPRYKFQYFDGVHNRRSEVEGCFVAEDDRFAVFGSDGDQTYQLFEELGKIEGDGKDSIRRMIQILQNYKGKDKMLVLRKTPGGNLAFLVKDDVSLVAGGEERIEEYAREHKIRERTKRCMIGEGRSLYDLFAEIYGRKVKRWVEFMQNGDEDYLRRVKRWCEEELGRVDEVISRAQQLEDRLSEAQKSVLREGVEEIKNYRTLVSHFKSLSEFYLFGLEVARS